MWLRTENFTEWPFASVLDEDTCYTAHTCVRTTRNVYVMLLMEY